MADKYISVEAFTASVRERYCKNCDRRKGMKNGKLKTVYAIGDAPCRACGIDDMVDDIDAYPPADVVARDCFNRILAENDTMRGQLAAIGKKPGDKMDDVRPVVEISDAVDEVLDFLNENYNCMPYHIYSALYDLASGICQNCGADMREVRE